jgi:hypothetical protein
MDAAKLLGGDFLSNALVKFRIEQIKGSRLSYPTWYRMCQLLSFDPAAPTYTAKEALDLFTLMWAKSQKLRNVTEQTIEQVQPEFIQYLRKQK